MASDIAKPNMDGLNRAGEQSDLAVAGGNQANLKLAQQFMALAQSDSKPNEAQVAGEGQITIDGSQNKPAHIGRDRIDWGFPEFGPGPINSHPPIWGSDQRPFLPPNIIPGRPIALPPDFTLGQSISLPTGTLELVDGEWIYTPREPDVITRPDHGGLVQICPDPDEGWHFSPNEPDITIEPIDPPTRITAPGIFEISDGEWIYTLRQPEIWDVVIVDGEMVHSSTRMGEVTFDGSGQSAEES